MNTEHHKLIILGSGPAGCTAAIYAARANLSPAIITGIEQGGQLTKTSEIGNWPGEFEVISGLALMEKILTHAKNLGTNIISDNILQADLSQRPFKLRGENTEYLCDALIIATGASAKYLGIPSEQKYAGRGVSACAVCDGFFYRNKKVVVVGGGNTAAEDALYLSKLAGSVTIVHRRTSLRADPIVIAQLEKTPNITFEWDSTVEEILGDDHGVTGIKIKNVSSGVTKDLATDAVFIAIGHKPNTTIFSGQIELDHEYIKVGCGLTTATNIPGVFAAGDVSDSNYRQAIVAAGSGCKAALDVKKFFDSLAS